MGLWIHNVGVRAASLPEWLAARASSEPAWLPRASGWSWISIDDFIEETELDELVHRLASEAAAPAIGFSVYDSDAVYLVGRDAADRRFRFIVNEESYRGYDGEAAQEPEAAIAWSAAHTPKTISRDELDEVARTNYVFAEEGLWVLFARLGLVPEEDAGEPETIGDEEEFGEDRDELVLEPALYTPIAVDMELPDRVYVAEITYADGDSGQVLIVEHDLRADALIGVDDESVTYCYAIAADGEIALRTISNGGVALLRNSLAAQGCRVEGWAALPAGVPRTLRAATAWVLRSRAPGEL